MSELQSVLKFSGLRNNLEEIITGFFQKSPKFSNASKKAFGKMRKMWYNNKKAVKKMQNTNSKKPKSISKLLYLFAILLWVINLTYSVMRLFFELSQAWNLLFFIAVIIVGILSNAFNDENAFPDITYNKKFLDYCLTVSLIISVICAVVSGVCLLIAGGGPKIVDDAYYIYNNGQMVRPISEQQFFFFSVCESLIFSCVVLIFSSAMAKRVHTMYSLQKLSMKA